MGVKLIGFEKLEAKLTKNMDLSKVKATVKKNGAQLQKKAQKNAPVGTPQSTGIPGYVGGTLKRSIGLEITDGGMTAEVESTAEYAGYQEYGTRFMKGKPHIRPAFEEQKEKFKADMKELVR
ncbi:HK97 gp10 family phage protein [Dorea sp. MB18-49]|jgi:HK97 gp10 family phage protein|uniref:HK97-gp10 family putative phage morphogenesis protein n=1 Tax=Dorea sp. MB18-49 TaxID=2949745 RepID=UPI00202EC992|nr:HK97-gp10 family putative phage morphogenesis protein [Dorea sp. MB18-49]MCM1893938.1 HK97 gp10 family phage protein [Dorea sp. MB18-49]